MWKLKNTQLKNVYVNLLSEYKNCVCIYDKFIKSM